MIATETSDEDRLVRVRVEDVASEPGRLADVLRLYREHSQTLGFMPQGAFEQRADKGTLLVAITANGSTAGYVLYDLPRSHITIRHLCVDPSHRGRGVARAMVDELKRRHPERLGIRADCRNDYEAHTMWPALDFEATTEAPGRSRKGLPLTSWWLDFGYPTLFTTEDRDEPRVRIAIDTDVFIDLFEERPHCQESRGLMTDWVVDVAELVITKSVINDINKHPDPTVRARRRADAVRFTRADSQEADWRRAESQLFETLGHPHLSAHDRLDLRHVARAAAAKVGLFASRDEPLVKRLRNAAWKLFRLQVGTPGDLLTELWDQIAEPYAPVLLENTRVKLEQPSPDRDEELHESFLNTRTGERKGELTKLLRACRSDPRRWEIRLVRGADDSLMALFARSTAGPVLEVPLLRVTGRPAATMARHIAHLLRTSAILASASAIKITDQMMSVQVPDALSVEGYVSSGGCWWASPVDKHASREVLAEDLEALGTRLPDSLELDRAVERLRSADLQAAEVAELERRFAPMKIAEAPLVAYLIPIQPQWAEQLFDTDLSEQTLFARNEALALSREHVYYSAAARGSLAPPARLAWYVSVDRRRPGTGAVRAVSRLEEVLVGRPLDLHRRFGHLGVYRREQLLEMAPKTGKLVALRFADTEVFADPVPREELIALAKRYGSNLVLRSPQRLPEHLFDSLYARGRRTHGPD